MNQETDNSQKNEFQAESQRKRTGLFREFLDFLRHNKKWWLTPIILIILLVGVMIISMGGIGPFIYALF